MGYFIYYLIQKCCQECLLLLENQTKLSSSDLAHFCPFSLCFSNVFDLIAPESGDDPSISVEAAMAAVYILNACWSVKSTVAAARLGVIVCAGLLRLNV